MISCTLENAYRICEERRKKIEETEKREKAEALAWVVRLLGPEEAMSMKPKKGCKGGK
jgi:hypothetical protein